MKHIITIISLLVALGACSDASLIKIGSYNIWMTHLGKGQYEWSQRSERLAKSIVEMDMDIFGAQEVDTLAQRVMPELLKEQGAADYTWFIFSPYAEDGGVGNKAQAIVYKTERFEVLEDHHFWFSETPDVISSGWDEMKFKRGGFCLTMLDKLSGKKFFVMHSHMPLARQAGLHAAEILLEKAQEYNPEGLPAFFLGDLNTTPDSAASELFRTYWSDSFLELLARNKVYGPMGSFNGAKVSRNMNAARRIDYVYYRGEQITPIDYTCWSKLYDGLFPSDHCAVFCNFLIK